MPREKKECEVWDALITKRQEMTMVPIYLGDTQNSCRQVAEKSEWFWNFMEPVPIKHGSEGAYDTGFEFAQQR